MYNYREHAISTMALYTSTCILKLEASTMYETHSIVTFGILVATDRPEGHIIVGCAVYTQVCIPEQYAIIASTVTYCMQ